MPNQGGCPLTRRQLLLLGSIGLVAACAGHAAPSAAPTPAAERPAAAAPARDPSTLRYAVGASRYHEAAEISQDVMGQASTFNAHAYLSTVVSAAGTNLGVAVTIDSLSSNVPEAEGMGIARGRVVNLVFSPTGQLVSMTSPDSTNMALFQVAEGLRELLPRLPNGAITAGATWSDTVVRRVPAPDVTLTLTIARQHRVVGWEDHDGTRALHLSTTGSYTMAGSGVAQGQTLELSGTGRNQAEHFVSVAGVYLGNTEADTADVNVSVASAGMRVAVRRTQRSTVTRLP